MSRVILYLLLFIMATKIYAQELPNIAGRWNMDIDNIRVLLKTSQYAEALNHQDIIDELIEDKRSGKDVVFRGDDAAFVNGDKLVQRYKFRLFWGGDKRLRIQIFNFGSYGWVSILAINGDHMVFLAPENNQFEPFHAYKREVPIDE